MADITQAILSDLAADLSINTTNICLDIQSKGVFKKKQFLHIFGSVHSLEQREKVEKTVKRFAGDKYAVESHLVVK